jgi:predicted RNase H-like HicB family nuclease
MNDLSYLPLNNPSPKSYVCRAVVEPHDSAWYAHCPALAAYGASTWGPTPESALRQLQTAVERIVTEVLARGEALPDGVMVAFEPLVSVVSPE